MHLRYGRMSYSGLATIAIVVRSPVAVAVTAGVSWSPDAGGWPRSAAGVPRPARMCDRGHVRRRRDEPERPAAAHTADAGATRRRRSGPSSRARGATRARPPAWHGSTPPSQGHEDGRGHGQRGAGRVRVSAIVRMSLGPGTRAQATLYRPRRERPPARHRAPSPDFPPPRGRRAPSTGSRAARYRGPPMRCTRWAALPFGLLYLILLAHRLDAAIGSRISTPMRPPHR